MTEHGTSGVRRTGEKEAGAANLEDDWKIAVAQAESVMCIGEDVQLRRAASGHEVPMQIPQACDHRGRVLRATQQEHGWQPFRQIPMEG